MLKIHDNFICFKDRDMQENLVAQYVINLQLILVFKFVGEEFFVLGNYCTP